MKRIAGILLALLIAGAGAETHAQNYVATPVTVSKEKVKLGGKVYLSHVVLEKQTIYGITKAYGITEEELYQANPQIKEQGLQKNAIILIPYQEPASQDVQPSGASAGEPAGDYTEHTRKWYEDLDDIAKKYGVSVKDIMDFNGLKDKKLAPRQVLRIPLGPQPESAQTLPDEVQAAGTPEPSSTPSEGTPEVFPKAAPAVTSHAAPADSTSISIPHEQAKDVVRMTLLLPLNSENGQPSGINMDFYSGVLMALKDFEREKIKVEAQVCDIMTGIPSAEKLQNSDFVLGPIAAREVEYVLFNAEGKTRVISPLDQKAAALGSSYSSFIQVPSSQEIQYEDLAAWVKEDLQPSDTVLFVSEKGASSVSAQVQLRSALAKEGVPYEILNYAILEGRELPEVLSERMTQGGVNRIVAASESEAFIDDLVRNLGIMMGKGYRVVMYAPSKVRNFDTIEGSAYHNVSLHVSTSYYADYRSPEVDSFVKSYRSLFLTEPSQFAFQGYDTARYFVNLFREHPRSWELAACGKRVRGLHTDFLFENNGGNLRGKAVRRVVYNKDYTISLYGTN